MTYREARRAWEKAYWLDLLTRTKANVSAAALEAGIRRQEVYAHVHRHGLEACLRGPSWAKTSEDKPDKPRWSRTKGGAHEGSARARGAALDGNR